DLGRMAAECPHLPARGWIPELYGVVKAGGGEGAAVRAESHVNHRDLVTVQGVHLPAGDGVPDPQRAVQAAGGEGTAVGTVRDARAPVQDEVRLAGAPEIVPLEAPQVGIRGSLGLERLEVLLHQIGPALLPGLTSELDLRWIQSMVAEQLLVPGALSLP